MAGGSLYQDDDGAVITDINVTPFVDVALVLLVIFMVTARLIVQRGVEVEKPKSSVGQDVPGTVIITVDKGGVVYIKGEAYPDRVKAKQTLTDLAKRDPNAKAIIVGDTSAAYGAIFGAIELAKTAGIESISLANDPAAAPTTVTTPQPAVAPQ
ncbi:MAG: biopolymer transporter ExbD [Myxococcales bacterium]|nr:biopolymer transporter ExbD [Myxococcales bacterium]